MSCIGMRIVPLVTMVMISAYLSHGGELSVQSSPPDLMTMQNGAAVGSPEDWTAHRAPELRELIQRYEYGRFPSKPAEYGFKLLREDVRAFEGKATLKEIEVRCTAPNVRVHLLLVVPNARTAPAPCFLGINFYGNHTVVADQAVELPLGWMPSEMGAVNHRATEAGRGLEVAAWAIEQSIDRGYAVATFYHGDIIPDELGLAREKLAQFRPAGVAVDASDAPATIACWAWGFSRMLDYLVTDPDIDAGRVAAVGHSRNGKTALLAAAMDERIALVIPSQSGCGGAGPCRDIGEDWAARETVKQITDRFPHWFCSAFAEFGEAPERLPFDQHALIALCAPRPVLLSNAKEDRWANPAGQFAMLKAAGKVYQLASGETLEPLEMPKTNQLVDGRLGYFIRPGQHAMTTADWKVWLDYADRWLDAKPHGKAASVH